MTMSDIQLQLKDVVRDHVKPYQEELARAAAMMQEVLQKTAEPATRERLQRQIESTLYYSNKAPL